MIDYDGLSRLLTYHKYITLKGKIAEEKLWLQQSKQDCEGLGVNIDKINQYFKNHVWYTNSYNPVVSVGNLVGTRWLSDDVINKDRLESIQRATKPRKQYTNCTILRILTVLHKL